MAREELIEKQCNLKLIYEHGAIDELTDILAKEFDSFILDCYKECFGKEYKKGDNIPEGMQEKWINFVRSKLSE